MLITKCTRKNFYPPQMERVQVSKLQLLMHFCFVLLYLSCTTNNNKAKQQISSNFVPFKAAQSNDSSLTAKQQTAFNALNSIQVQGIYLYSTFSGIHHNCLPPDTSFIISQAELLVAIESLLEKYYTHIKAEQRAKLASESVLAQEKYLVLQCKGYTNGAEYDKSNNIPKSGSWILPKVLGRRDIVIEW
jgi:hypothetical protein